MASSNISRSTATLALAVSALFSAAFSCAPTGRPASEPNITALPRTIAQEEWLPDVDSAFGVASSAALKIAPIGRASKLPEGFGCRLAKTVMLLPW